MSHRKIYFLALMPLLKFDALLASINVEFESEAPPTPIQLEINVQGGSIVSEVDKTYKNIGGSEVDYSSLSKINMKATAMNGLVEFKNGSCANSIPDVPEDILYHPRIIVGYEPASASPSENHFLITCTFRYKRNND